MRDLLKAIYSFQNRPLKLERPFKRDLLISKYAPQIWETFLINGSSFPSYLWKTLTNDSLRRKRRLCFQNNLKTNILFNRCHKIFDSVYSRTWVMSVSPFLIFRSFAAMAWPLQTSSCSPRHLRWSSKSSGNPAEWQSCFSESKNQNSWCIWPHKCLSQSLS